jgi:2-iminobutanoate/2-iminopropanoate deaminase
MSDAGFRGVEVSGVRAPAGGFVHATVVRAGSDLVFVSGQTPQDVDGSVPADFEGQARIAWRNVERTLGAAGCTLDDVAKVNMYIRGRQYREVNRAVRNEVLGARRPALTVLVTDHWDEEWLIEIEVVAARSPAGPASSHD